MSKTPIVVVTHFMNYCIATDLLWPLVHTGREIILLVDESNHVVNRRRIPYDVEVISFDVNKDGNQWNHDGSQSIPYDSIYANCDIPLFKAWSHLKHHDSFWIIEYDVRNTGDWNLLLDQYDNVDVPIFAPIGHNDKPLNVANRTEWWVSKTMNYDYDKQNWYAGFVYLWKPNSRLISLILSEYQKGHRGFCEIFYPTVSKRYDLNAIYWDHNFLGDPCDTINEISNEEYAKIKCNQVNKIIHKVK